ncbi:MAG: lipoyl synthase [Spirochaetaceae bacterium]|jgi:lipoic acid synthetase|nr:lipoyl synthase [Spirochaetaceae bacterium]
MNKPNWIRTHASSGGNWQQVYDVLHQKGLHTVCDEARCPNKGECWGCGTATFMILGDICTRGCRFCAVATAKEGRPVEADEGVRIGMAARELGLKYIVLTSVDRDDLPDRGAGHFARCINDIRNNYLRDSYPPPLAGGAGGGADQALQIEALIPDYTAEELEPIIEARPFVLAHNVETVPRLQGVRDGRASFEKSLATLDSIKKLTTKEKKDSGFDKLNHRWSSLSRPLTKSSIMLGLGETEKEVLETMDALRSVGTDILVLGQYLQPTKQQVPVVEYITPEQFKEYGAAAKEKGFSFVVSAPLARTSYHAASVAC